MIRSIKKAYTDFLPLFSALSVHFYIWHIWLQSHIRVLCSDTWTAVCFDGRCTKVSVGGSAILERHCVACWWLPNAQHSSSAPRFSPPATPLPMLWFLAPVWARHNWGLCSLRSSASEQRQVCWCHVVHWSTQSSSSVGSCSDSLCLNEQW